MQRYHQHPVEHEPVSCGGCPVKKFAHKSILFFPFPPNRLASLFSESIIEDGFKGLKFS